MGVRGSERKVRLYEVFVGIDPDTEKSGWARVEKKTRRVKVEALAFPELLEKLRGEQRRCEVKGEGLLVVIEAGWLIHKNWHLAQGDGEARAASKGNAVGRNHEVGRKIAEMCEWWGIPYELVKPLRKKVAGRYLWKGLDGKITHEEISRFMDVGRKTNQEMRDAALIAWERAGLPVKI